MQREAAQLMFKLAYSKKNWGNKYDRLEHFKRFPNLKKVVKELESKGWLLVYRKPSYTGISLNTKYKSGIISFIEKELPKVKGILK